MPYLPNLPNVGLLPWQHYSLTAADLYVFVLVVAYVYFCCVCAHSSSDEYRKEALVERERLKLELESVHTAANTIEQELERLEERMSSLGECEDIRINSSDTFSFFPKFYSIHIYLATSQRMSATQPTLPDS